MLRWGPATAIVLNPSDTTPETTLLMVQIVSKFVLEKTFNVLTGDWEIGRFVVEEDISQMITIISSVRAASL